MAGGAADRSAAGRERKARVQAGGAWDSALSAQEFAAVEGAGFEPVGQVLGTAVFHIGYVGNWCSNTWSSSWGSAMSSTARAPFSDLVRAMYAARRQAVGRAVAECRGLGGDGVVGVKLRVGAFPAGGVEFTALGTAVRAVSPVRPARPFTSHLSGQDFARLVHSGWVPTGLAFGISVATRHDDYDTRVQTGRFAGNREVDGYTELITHARRDARAQLARDAASNGGDGVVVDETDVRVREQECGNGYRDHIVEAVFVGTSIARFGRSRRHTGPRPLTIMRLERER
ncbi:heavy metal-binding domain-containing protein [Streptomyces sp. NBC_01198]|uniref:heavy metal-binding domain-containing protein n=1 Tax=Streptomyces sp. NBC_01198 TaxID=2903769 RepID=UPI002E153051|nr:heavy metal-binding domain-containing protein [Streptomyces sp. NBC_01198]